AWVSNLKPSTTYTFTVHSTYGTEFCMSSSWTTRMRITIITAEDLLNNATNQIYLYVLWATGNAAKSNIYKFTYQSVLGNGMLTSADLGESYTANYGYCDKVWIPISNPNRVKNVLVIFTISWKYVNANVQESLSANTVIFKDTDGDGLFNVEELSQWEGITDKNGDGKFDIWQTDLDWVWIPYGVETQNNLNSVVNCRTEYRPWASYPEWNLPVEANYQFSSHLYKNYTYFCHACYQEYPPNFDLLGNKFFIRVINMKMAVKLFIAILCIFSIIVAIFVIVITDTYMPEGSCWRVWGELEGVIPEESKSISFSHAPNREIRCGNYG
ncbi:MAG: hypothetical protein ACPL1Y_03670, partial [Thermoplasmata archaeon]